MISEILKRHLSDKATHHNYSELYDKLLPPYRESATSILELGVEHGCSLRAWREYFTNAVIYGIDNDRSKLDAITDRDRIVLYHGDTRDRNAFIRMAKALPDFDFICDDGGHVAEEQLFAIATLWPRLKKGGIYIVEDIANRDHLELFQCFQNVELFDLRVQGGVADDMLAVLRKA